MKKLALPALAAAAVLSSGCNAPPPRTDPFEGIQSAEASPFRGLTVALLPTENTRKAMSYMRDKRLGGVGNIDAAPVFQEITGVFQATFGGVTKIAGLAEAPGARTDLVAVVDLYVKKGITMVVDAKVILMTPDGRRLEELDAEGTQSQYAYVSMSAEPYMVDAARKAAAKLRAALLSSPALAELAKSRPGATAAAAPAPPPAAEPLRSDVDSPAYASAERPDDYALVVGVEKYSALPPAEFAERDAAAVKKHLLALGYPERNILYLTGAQASRAALAKNLEAWLPRNVDERSTVFFYYSGHGSPDARTGEAYLLPWDADAQSLEFTAYPIKRLYEKLNALKAKRVLVALDACFSGAGGRSVIARGARPLVSKVDTAPEAAGKLVVFTASAADEITGAEESQGHGLFTYNFLKALNASGGAATVKSLYASLRPRVQDAARRENRDQTPQLIPADLGDRASLGLR